MPTPKALLPRRILQCPGDKYPILSFLSGVYAGGENDLNCYETVDYMNAYLACHVSTDTSELFNSWLVPQLNENPLPRPHPTSAQWDQLFQLLKEELQQPARPVSIW